MQIRTILPEDRAEWVRMRNRLWPGTPDDHERETREFFAAPPPGVAVFVLVREDGGLGGFIELSQRNYAEGCVTSPVGYIEGWYVDSDLRRQGYGAALVQTGEQWARKQGLQEIASDAELENERSIRAHIALGYQEVERVVCFRKSLESGDAEYA